jgi:hypothetical protein
MTKITVADLTAAKKENFEKGHQLALQHGVKYIIPTCARVHGYFMGQIVVAKVVTGK